MQNRYLLSMNDTRLERFRFFYSFACRAIFHLNYLTKEIHLNLSSAEDPERNNLLDLAVQNKFDQPQIIDGNITYICKTTNDCAMQFYQSTIQN